jgi:DNA polymerase-1
MLNPQAKSQIWDKLRNPNCTDCVLHKEANTVCLMGDGPVPSKIMLVGEAPGAREDDIERPFSGAAGQYLDRVLKKAGLSRNELFITNSVRCRPPDNRTPTPGEIKACGPYLRSEMESVAPDFVLLLGNAALKAVLNESGIMSKRGTSVVANGRTIFRTIHPAAVLRNPALENVFLSDLLRFSRMVHGETKTPVTVSKLIRTSASLAQFLKLVAQLDPLTPIAFDVETRSTDPEEEEGGLHPWSPQGVVDTVAFCWTPGESYVIALEHPEARWDIPVERVYQALDVAFEGRRMVGHNVKFDVSWMQVKGTRLYAHADTKYMAHLIDENSPQGLKHLARAYLGAGDYEAGISFTGVIPLRKEAIYNGKDADYTLRLYFIFRELLKAQPRVARLFVQLAMPATRAFTQIEANGFPVDMDRLESRHQEILNTIKDITEKLMSHVPAERPARALKANFRSPIFLGWLLFEHLKLPVMEIGKASGRPSTREAVLLQLRRRHQVPDLLMELRKWQKYESTYTRNWLSRVARAGKPRLFTSYNLSGTDTGRLSSNMQQVPRDLFIRSIIGSGPGWKFIEADFSQVELRIAAMLSRDASLTKAFVSGGDPHRETAAKILGKSPDQVTKDERKMAKAVNFGFLYGMGWRKFMVYAEEKYDVKVTEAEAQAYRRAFFAQYSGLPSWHDRQRRLARAQRQVSSPIGRVRHLPAMDSTDEMAVAEAERQAINSPVQGFASDMTVLAMTILQDKLDPHRAKIIGNVHDSIMAEATDDYAGEAAKIIKEVMEHLPLQKMFGYKPTVPIEAEVTIGQHWGETS